MELIATLLRCGTNDLDFLQATVDEFDLEYSEVCRVAEDGSCETVDFNGLMFSTFQLAWEGYKRNIIDKLNEFADREKNNGENWFEYFCTTYEEAVCAVKNFNPNIYLNYSTSCFDSIVSDYIDTDPDEDNIVDFLIKAGIFVQIDEVGA